jgi:hypothetical protein
LNSLLGSAKSNDNDAQQNQQSEADKQTESNGQDSARAGSGSASARLGNPAPIVLIPGPPGKPGLPGIPGLPGKPGKIPNFRGLKAILTTRVAELLAFLAVLAVLMILKFLGLLGLLLGLVLPIYGKLKKAGVLVPGESGGYEEAAPSYGPPPPQPYGRRKRAAPMYHSLYNLDRMAQHVMSNMEAAASKMQ